MKTSTETTEIFKALATAQGKFPEIPKDKKVDVKNKDGKFLYCYYYAELPSIISAIRPHLVENGLSFSQGMSEDGNFCITRIFHSSGQWIETQYPFKAKEADMQGLAGGYTFARRYGISAALGIATEFDDDANGADQKNATISSRETPQQKTPVKNVINEFKNDIAAQDEDPGLYRPKLGKYKGMTLKEINIHELNNYVKFLTDSANSQNKPLTGNGLELVQVAEVYMRSLEFSNGARP